MKFQVVKSFNTIMEEEAIHILLEKNGKIYEASGLFFEWNEINDEENIKVLETVTDIPEDAQSIVDTIIELKKKYRLKVFDDTRKTLLHWQFMEGVTSEIVL